MTDTIFALSSGAPPAAIALVRISGPGADPALEALAGRLPAPRRASRVTLRHRGEKLDDALALRFPGPDSVTGDDVVELHLHGGRAVVAGVLDALGAMPGLRPAVAGEFTRRAFDNGRLDLAEAEGLGDLLAAETGSQRRSALALAGGALSRQVESWRGRLVALAAQVEAELDFSDEADVAGNSAGASLADTDALAAEMSEWLSRPPAERLRDGVRVVIAGPPNSGKSSLINVLAGRDVAITSAIAGTTRDLVEAPTAIQGAPFLLVDTAGLRPSDDPIESIGIERAMASVDQADLILWLGPPLDCPDRDRSLIVHSKADVVPPGPDADVAVSASTGEGIDRLIDLLAERSRALLPGESDVALNQRHRAALAEALEAIVEANRSGDLLISAESLRRARLALDRITGRAGVEDMLDALFGRFCIGK